MSPDRRTKASWFEKWAPILLATAVYVFTVVWYTAHLGAQVSQNSSEITFIKTELEPRGEIDKDEQHLKDDMGEVKQTQREQNEKLDLLLERSAESPRR